MQNAHVVIVPQDFTPYNGAAVYIPGARAIAQSARWWRPAVATVQPNAFAAKNAVPIPVTSVAVDVVRPLQGFGRRAKSVRVHPHVR